MGRAGKVFSAQIVGLAQADDNSDDLLLEDIPMLIGQLETKMKAAAKNLEFEEASTYRDRIKHLRDRLLGKHRSPFKQAQDADRAASE